MKNLRNTPSIATIVCAVLFVLTTSCDREADNLTPATFPETPEVFIDGFSAGLNYAAFAGSKVTAFDVDTEVFYAGTSSMRIEVPDAGDPEGAYAGGVYFDATGRDLSAYNVLTFWAKASRAGTIDVLGFGNDLGELRYQATIENTPVNTNWKKYYIPIPDPSLLTQEKGMFFYSEGPEDGTGYTIWFDEVQFENLGTVAHGKVILQDGNADTLAAFTGQTIPVTNTAVTFNLPTGIDIQVNPTSNYFNYTSTNEDVATISGNEASVIGTGTATITASISGLESSGSLTLVATGFTPAPTPMQDAENVISLFSDEYDNEPVDFYNGFYAPFQTTTSADFEVNGDNVLNYQNYNFVGIEFNQNVPTIDASEMTTLHVDIFIPDEFDPASNIRINLVDFGADQSFDGGDDTSISTTITTASTPALATGSWISIDFDITGLATRTNLGQIVFDAAGNFDPRPSAFYVDNLYFYNADADTGGSGTEPTTAAPTPTRNAANVISLFSDAYTDVTVDTWRTSWSSADFEDVTVDGNATKKYSNLDFVGIETVASQVDASSMTHIHLDVWSPDFTSFSLKLVDFGPNGVFDGGDDAEHQVDFAMPARGEWVSYDIPLSDFTQLLTSSNIAQYVMVAQPTGNATVFVDNIYFYQE